MTTYKITNVTNLVGKRDPRFNSVVNVEYIDGRTKKIITLRPSESVFLTVQSLPLSVHRLRIKKLVEVSTAELKKTMDKPKPKTPRKSNAVKKESVVAKEKESTSVKKTTTKKTTTRKKLPSN